jgi:peptidoglycan/LPS O-acetylase OafA/YrhL
VEDRRGVAAGIVWPARRIRGAWGPGFQGVWTYLFIGSTFGFFMLGHLVCLAPRRWPMLTSPKGGLALTVCAFAAMTYGGDYTYFDSFRFWLAVLLFTLALPGLFEATKGVRWMNWLGDLSYPVYLVHSLVLVAVSQWWLSVGSNDLSVGYLRSRLSLRLRRLRLSPFTYCWKSRPRT